MYQDIKTKVVTSSICCNSLFLQPLILITLFLFSVVSNAQPSGITTGGITTGTTTQFQPATDALKIPGSYTALKNSNTSGDCPGGDIQNAVYTNITSASMCAQKCNFTQGCKSISYNAVLQKGSCILKVTRAECTNNISTAAKQIARSSATPNLRLLDFYQFYLKNCANGIINNSGDCYTITTKKPNIVANTPVYTLLKNGKLDTALWGVNGLACYITVDGSTMVGPGSNLACKAKGIDNANKNGCFVLNTGPFGYGNNSPFAAYYNKGYAGSEYSCTDTHYTNLKSTTYPTGISAGAL